MVIIKHSCKHSFYLVSAMNVIIHKKIGTQCQSRVTGEISSKTNTWPISNTEC